jgi:hypothetical protein
MRPMWRNCLSHIQKLSNENFPELENELSDEDDESSDAKPVRHTSTKQMTEFFKHTDTATSIIDDNDALHTSTLCVNLLNDGC